MSKTFDELVNVSLASLDAATLNEHKQSVLGMTNEDIIKYLEHLIDDEYQINEEEGVEKNNPNLVSFLKDDDFKQYYDVILKETDDENISEEV